MQASFFRASDAARWDDICAKSYCATLLHTRKFLSYHADRFLDRSVVVTDGDNWLGVMPAARHPDAHDTVVSHPGVTYGGMIHCGQLRGAAMVEALESAAALFRTCGFATLLYKAVPHIYQQAPAQDDLYALHRMGARMFRCDLSSCIDLAGRLPLSERRRRALKKAVKSSVTVDSGPEYAAALWEVVEANLSRKHGVRPTHSYQEIALLAERFPDEIEFHVAKLGSDVVAGVVLFVTRSTVHAQYIAANEAGYAACALDAVFEACIQSSGQRNARYFDFGISTEAQGTVLNEGLYRFKCEFGASGVTHQFYELALAHLPWTSKTAD